MKKENYTPEQFAQALAQLEQMRLSDSEIQDMLGFLDFIREQRKKQNLHPSAPTSELSGWPEILAFFQNRSTKKDECH